MISFSTLTLSDIPSPATGEKYSTSSSSPSSPEIETRRIKSSPQLNRWSRARAVRSGRKLGRPVERPVNEMVFSDSAAGVVSERNDTDGMVSDGGTEGENLTDVTAGAKSIYIVSDGTGWTAENSVNAALGQFEHCLVDRGCPINTHLFSGVS